jgi:hypothetical protein
MFVPNGGLHHIKDFIDWDELQSTGAVVFLIVAADEKLSERIDCPDVLVRRIELDEI